MNDAKKRYVGRLVGRYQAAIYELTQELEELPSLPVYLLDGDSKEEVHERTVDIINLYERRALERKASMENE